MFRSGGTGWTGQGQDWRHRLSYPGPSIAHPPPSSLLRPSSLSAQLEGDAEDRSGSGAHALRLPAPDPLYHGQGGTDSPGSAVIIIFFLRGFTNFPALLGSFAVPLTNLLPVVKLHSAHGGNGNVGVDSRPVLPRKDSEPGGGLVLDGPLACSGLKAGGNSYLELMI